LCPKVQLQLGILSKYDVRFHIFCKEYKRRRQHQCIRAEKHKTSMQIHRLLMWRNNKQRDKEYTDACKGIAELQKSKKFP